MAAPNLLRFGRFELDVQSRELRDGSTMLRLQAQPFEILCLMLEHRGAVVTREQFRQSLCTSAMASPRK
jgi:DNA-binding response OmpR family regulator